MNIVKIPLSKLKQAPWRFSENWADGKAASRKPTPILNNLVVSLGKHGQETPIHVRPAAFEAQHTAYEILDGHIVVDAARQLRWTEVAAIVHDLDDAAALLFYTRHNLNRCGQYGHYHVKIHRVWDAVPGATSADKAKLLQENCSWPVERIQDYLDLNEKDRNWATFFDLPRTDDQDNPDKHFEKTGQPHMGFDVEETVVPDNQ